MNKLWKWLICGNFFSFSIIRSRHLINWCYQTQLEQKMLVKIIKRRCLIIGRPFSLLMKCKASVWCASPVKQYCNNLLNIIRQSITPVTKLRNIIKQVTFINKSHLYLISLRLRQCSDAARIVKHATSAIN